jgi:hypothetical protein
VHEGSLVAPPLASLLPPEPGDEPPFEDEPELAFGEPASLVLPASPRWPSLPSDVHWQP